MSIYDLVNRTKTFISGDWTGDQDLIAKLKEWNQNNNLGLNFVDVHELTQSYDTSNPCSIKASLRQRLNISKTFVLIAGRNTLSLTKGACRYCSHYSTWYTNCAANGKPFDNRSFIEFECEMALKDYNAGELKKIVVIYNGLITPERSRCPEVLRYVGTHIGSDCWNANGQRALDYQEIKKAICW